MITRATMKKSADKKRLEYYKKAKARAKKEGDKMDQKYKIDIWNPRPISPTTEKALSRAKKAIGISNDPNEHRIMFGYRKGGRVKANSKRKRRK
jgi:hypothetical protein